MCMVKVFREKNPKIDMKVIQCKIPKRYVIGLMILIGYINNLYLHTNLSMVVVDITTFKNITHPNGTTEQKVEFNWSSTEKGVILSSLGYGQMISPLGGLLAGRFGGGTIYGIGILVSALITFFNPFLLHANIYAFIAANIIHGICEVFTFASITHIYSRWVPPNERARFVAFGLIGVYVGCVVSFVVAGWILSTYRWEMLYYVSGIVAFVWYLIWVLIVRNDPADDKCISETERQYIWDKIKKSDHEKLVYPWKSILKCLPFWAGCFAKFAIGCGYVFTISNLPQYIKDSSEMDIKGIGYISTIPHISAVVALILTGFLSDYLRSHEILSITNIHKLFTCSGLLTGSLTYLVVVLCPNFYIDIVAISALSFFGTISLIDLLVLLLDMAPKYAAFLHGVVNVFFTSTSVIVPMLVGFVVTSHTLLQWNICFVILSSVYLCAGLIFLKFGSGNQRSWADYNPSKGA